MRYDVLHPAAWFDPRSVELGSLDHLYKLASRRDELATEQEAVYAVRRVYPDAIAMPVPIQVGSGKMVVLGILDKRRAVDAESEIDFALIVVAHPEHDADRALIKKGRVFDQNRWKPPVVRPEMAKKHSVDLRGTDLALPVTVMAEVGHYQGRLAIRAELDGIAISLVFDDKAIQIVDTSASEAPATISSDGDGSGTTAA